MLGLAEPKRLYQKIGRDIRQQIVDGVYEVGSRLPAERDIAEMLNVSRTIVREALIMLELEGLIEVRKGSGIHVIASENTQNVGTTSENDAAAFNDVGPFELLQARQLIESHVASFAATQLNKTNLQNMRSALELEKQELGQGVNTGKGDELFHMAIAEATQNSVLVALTQQLWEIRRKSPMWKRLHEWIDDVDYLEEWVDDHDKIIHALSCKNPEAARHAMWQHLENVKTTLLRVSDKANDSFDRFLFDHSPSVL
ncbi:GntR family transcriptional regulator [Endozoicomonas elysicola]|uniref:Transcriptional regulator n=1 Tax=Endozoicomonas elysicola TaxID=305900 RepID=A0A081KGW6_9GAMM|nr:GntR family transcriptional regulator [Endozoicomonas elysicola]KEI73392.1 transcriptional regulator [Endozoicomonas elysicola]